MLSDSETESGNEGSSMEEDEGKQDEGGSGAENDSNEEQEAEQPKVWTCGLCTSENDLENLGPYVEKACAVCHALRSGDPLWLCRNADEMGGECEAFNELEAENCSVCGGLRAAAEPWSNDELEQLEKKGRKRGSSNYERMMKKAYKRPRGSGKTSKSKGRRKRAASSDEDEGMTGIDLYDDKGRSSGGGGSGKGRVALEGKGKGSGEDKGKGRATGTAAQRGGAGTETSMQVKGGMVWRAEPEPEPMSTDEDSDVEDPEVPKDKESYKSYIAHKATSYTTFDDEEEGPRGGGARKRLSMPMGSGRDADAAGKRRAIPSPCRAVARGGGQASGGMASRSSESPPRRRTGPMKVARKGMTVDGESLDTGGGGKMRASRERRQRQKRGYRQGCLEFEDPVAERLWDGLQDLYAEQLGVMHDVTDWLRSTEEGRAIYAAARAKKRAAEPHASSQAAASASAFASASASASSDWGGGGEGRSAGSASGAYGGAYGGAHGGSRAPRVDVDMMEDTSESEGQEEKEEGRGVDKGRGEEKGGRAVVVGGASAEAPAPGLPLVSYTSDDEEAGGMGGEASTTEDEGDREGPPVVTLEDEDATRGTSMVPVDSLVVSGSSTASSIRFDLGEEGGVDEKGLDTSDPRMSDGGAGPGREKAFVDLTLPEEGGSGKAHGDMPEAESEEDGPIVLGDVDDDEDVHLNLTDDASS